uniref:Histone acetyltransferase n=1 Tax=Panagrolaimus sp. ES5 TaxID=591445 RepID=A0AC34GNZ9_9BILA
MDYDTFNDSLEMSCSQKTNDEDSMIMMSEGVEPKVQVGCNIYAKMEGEGEEEKEYGMYLLNIVHKYISRLPQPNMDYDTFNDSLEMSCSQKTNDEDSMIMMSEGVEPKVQVGCNIYAKMEGEGEEEKEYVLAEVRGIKRSRKNQSFFRYYVHFIGYNRRYDRWLEEDSLDFTRVTYPESSQNFFDYNTSNEPVQDNEAERRNIESICLNGWKIVPCWCLSYWPSAECLFSHMKKCPLYGPPGKKIYEKENLAFFEIDGAIDDTYAMNLCVLSKLFLDHKALYYDAKIFHFYILCEKSPEETYNIVGYFSKELVEHTRITKEDIQRTMESFGLVKQLVEGVQVTLSITMVEKYFKNKKEKLHVDPEYLKWSPPITG